MAFAEKLRHFPVSFYSMIMGLLGLLVATEKAVEIFDLSMLVPRLLLYGVGAIFCLITVVLLFKLLFYKKEFLEEFAHPVKISFFPTFSISLLLFSIALLPIAQSVAFFVWVIGAAVHLAFTFVIISQWMKKSHYKIEHLNPAWFIPVVGNLLIPIAGVAFVSPEPLWFFFSIGIVFWSVLMTVVMYRIFYHESLPAKLLPTLFILIAPPAVACISYSKLVGQVDNFSRILYYFALFMAVLLLLNLRMFMNKQFYLSKWAYTFPLAALSIASALMFNKTGLFPLLYIHVAFLALTAVIVTVLLYKTIIAIARHEICVKD